VSRSSRLSQKHVLLSWRALVHKDLHEAIALSVNKSCSLKIRHKMSFYTVGGGVPFPIVQGISRVAPAGLMWGRP
jgi:hypothetical protein